MSLFHWVQVAEEQIGAFWDSSQDGECWAWGWAMVSAATWRMVLGQSEASSSVSGVRSAPFAALLGPGMQLATNDSANLYCKAADTVQPYFCSRPWTAMEIYDLDIKILSIDIGHRKDHIVSTINWAAFSLSYFKTTIQTLRCFIVKISTQGGHWLGEDIDWWHFVVKIQRQWDDLIWARHDTQRINEISRLCWRPNTSTQVSFIRHAFTLCRFSILTS